LSRTVSFHRYHSFIHFETAISYNVFWIEKVFAKQRFG